LREAQNALDDTTQTSKIHSKELLQQIQTFKTQTADVDRRLMIVTQSETSDDAVKKFDLRMESLQRLDVAQGYVELLREVEHLRFVAAQAPALACAYICDLAQTPVPTSKSPHKMRSSRICAYRTSSTHSEKLNPPLKMQHPI